MRAFGRFIIWMEDSKDLAQRWWAAHGGQPEAEGLTSAEDFLRRASERADKVLKFAGLVPPRPLRTPREWETSRAPDAAEVRLRASLKSLGWGYALLDKATPAPALVQVNAGQSNTLLLEMPTIEALCERFETGGLDVEFTNKDGRNLLLAQELYGVASEEMGLAPKCHAVDEVACHLFCQRALGWPFSAWTLDFT